MTGRTLEQRRAASALKAVKAVREDSRVAPDYRQQVKGLPAAVVTCGLGQAMAMARSKTDEPALQRLYEQVSGWLCRECPGSPLSGLADGDLLEAVCAADQDAYVWAQGEAIRYLHWLKTFAAALIPAPADRPGSAGP